MRAIFDITVFLSALATICGVIYAVKTLNIAKISIDPQISVNPHPSKLLDEYLDKSGLIPTENDLIQLELWNNSFVNLDNITISLDPITVFSPRYYNGLWVCDEGNGPWGDTTIASSRNLKSGEAFKFSVNLQGLFKNNVAIYQPLNQYVVILGDILRLRVKFERAADHSTYTRDFYFNYVVSAGAVYKYEDQPISFGHITQISQTEILDLLKSASARIGKDARCNSTDLIKKLYNIPSSAPPVTSWLGNDILRSDSNAEVIQ